MNENSEADTSAVKEGVKENTQISNEEIIEEKSNWIPRILKENPEFLCFREQTITESDTTSFSQASHTERTVFSPFVDRERVLGLIFQHLNAVGLHSTAQTIAKESGLEFQDIEEPFEYTGLRILVSLGMPGVKNPYSIKEEDDAGTVYVDEEQSDVICSSMIKDDTSLIYRDFLDFKINAVYNEKARINLSGIRLASIGRLAALLFLGCHSDSEISQLFISLLVLTPTGHFLEIAKTAYNFIENSKEMTEKQKKDLIAIQEPLRANIVKILGKWIKYLGLNINSKTLADSYDFFQKIVAEEENESIVSNAKDIMETMKSLKKGIYEIKTENFEHEILIPEIDVLLSPSLALVDLDPSEIACQICLVFHERLKSVNIREFYWAISDQDVSQKTPELQRFFDFTQQISCRFIEIIFTAKRRNETFKKLLEICCCLNAFNCFEGCRHILGVLMDRCLSKSEFVRSIGDKIKREWIRCGCDFKSLDEYNSMEKHAMECFSPCVPNIGRDLYVDSSNDWLNSPRMADGLVNYERERNISSIIERLYQFQNTEYNFTPIKPIMNLIIRQPKYDIDQMKKVIASNIGNRVQQPTS